MRGDRAEIGRGGGVPEGVGLGGRGAVRARACAIDCDMRTSASTLSSLALAAALKSHGSEQKDHGTRTWARDRREIER